MSFIALNVIIVRTQGLKSLISLIITVALIFFVFIPLIIKGDSHLLTSLGICIIATNITISTITGINKKSLRAIFRTLVGYISTPDSIAEGATTYIFLRNRFSYHV
ncbi:MAG: YibE/F family protein [Spirochaetaceae bacterium]|nr:YibE/F family protein [Spirochaetaceae bacterium]